MKIPKIKQKLKSFILDEQASLTKKSVIGIGLISFSLASLHSSEAARCVCSPECSCVGYTSSCGCDGYVPCTCDSEVGGCTCVQDTCGYLLDGALHCPSDKVFPCSSDPPSSDEICITESSICVAETGRCNGNTPCWCETECTQTCVTLGCFAHDGPAPCIAYCPSHCGSYGGGGY